jgi:DNA-binding CsgD family transcriptional regulator/tetratricopeptide (TPR) repeat protein
MTDVPGRVSSLRFVGRIPELERLEAAYKAIAADEGGRTVLLGGEAGVGKTRLVAELAARIDAAGGLVLLGSCFELANPAAPFGPVVQALRALQRAFDRPTWEAVVGPARGVVSRLLPDAAPDAPPGETSTAMLFEHLLGVLRRVGERAPMLLVVEDAHWGDHSTRDLVAFLARNLRDARVLLLVTFRTDDLHRRHPLRTVLVELERSGAAERVELARFDREELRDMVSSILGREPSPDLVETTFARCDGNAFFAEELIAGGDAAPLPDSLRDIVLARVDALGDAAQQVVRAAAVIGPHADDRLIAALVGLPDAERNAALRDATERQVLVVQPAAVAYGFRHALVREAVYDDLLPGERVRLHARIAAELAAHPDWCDGGAAVAAGELAGHWYAAHDAARALVASMEAARAAADMYAHPEARAHTERVLELWPQVPDAEAACGMSHLDVVHYAAAQAQLAGEPDRAIDFIASGVRDAGADADRTTLALMHERWARCLRVLGRPPAEILEHVDAAVALAGDDAPAARARVLATRGQQLMLSGRCAEATDPCEEAIELAHQVGDAATASHARNSLGVSIANLGDLDRGLAELRRARDEAIAARAWDDVTRADFNEASLLASAARHADVLDVVDRGIERAHAHGLRGTATRLGIPACEALWMLGRWDECAARIRDVEATRPRGVDAWDMTRLSAELDAAHGDFDAAATKRHELERMLGRDFDPTWQLVLTHLDVQTALWRGDFSGALDVAESFRTWSYGGTVCADSHPSTDLMLNTMAAAANQAARDRTQPGGRAMRTRARDVAEEFAAMFDDWRAGARWGLARPGDVDLIERQLRAELALVTGAGDASAWETLAVGWSSRGMRARAAYAWWREAEQRVAGNDRARATGAACAAHDAATTIGWRWVREGVADLARRARLDVVDDDALPAGAARAGLTSREAEVLRHVAAGRTNRQIGEALFISAKTASAHVSNVLVKLAVSNRAEAGAAARRLGLD